MECRLWIKISKLYYSYISGYNLLSLVLIVSKFGWACWLGKLSFVACWIKGL